MELIAIEMRLKYCECGIWTTKEVPACPRCGGQFSVKEVAAQQVAEFFTMHSLPGHYFESLAIPQPDTNIPRPQAYRKKSLTVSKSGGKIGKITTVCFGDHRPRGVKND